MTSPEPTEPSQALIVGISGPSSSGKTTLARLLQRIFCGVPLDSTSTSISDSTPGSTAQENNLNTFIIHEDDFYYPDDQYTPPPTTIPSHKFYCYQRNLTIPPRIPYTTTPSGKTVQDWDTSAAIDTSFLAQALSYVRRHGHLPPRLQSKEDQNENTGPCVPDDLVTQLRREVEARIAAKKGVRSGTLVFMEGFLLYASPEGWEVKNNSGKWDEGEGRGMSIIRRTMACYDLGYVTIGPAPEPPTAATAAHLSEQQEQKQAQSQQGEIDLEGEDDRPPQNFWTDPPGYVDDIVWPRYVRDHAWLLVDGEGEGDIVARVGEGVDVRHDVGVSVAPGKGAVGMDVVLRWAVEEVLGFYMGEE
ncbi:uncharacterized protein N7458_011382 [Penicillium daleae]|uniref:Phosphoribulokinase/uridine kinase domain-containing protein n=1 Tax=Penicillium daleae TaxID=63821 RepID=A0AAD6FVF4_9EURO|nr:uncharacterized protein N7458_011382 [Penicillium daleae]KAJ5432226.1 hypothetical protein N7458_011382 [Penicillium daleae]